MKIIGGSVWSRIRKARSPFRQLAYVFVCPYLLGLVAATMVVMWIPAGLLTNAWTVGCTFGIITLLLLLLGTGVIRRAVRARELDLEELANFLGVVLALTIGLYAYGVSPDNWKAHSEHQIIQETEVMDVNRS